MKKDSKPVKTWMKKWFQDSITHTLFLWVYQDHINWCLHEDAPWKDTEKTEINQTLSEYQTNGAPLFVLESVSEEEGKEIEALIQSIK